MTVVEYMYVKKLQFKIDLRISKRQYEEIVYSLFGEERERKKDRERDRKLVDAKVTLNIKAAVISSEDIHTNGERRFRVTGSREKSRWKFWTERRARHLFVSLSRSYVTSSLKYNRQRVVYGALQVAPTPRDKSIRNEMKSVLRTVERAPSDLAS